MDDSNSEELYSSGDNLGDQHLNRRHSLSDSSEELRKAAEESLCSSSSTLDVSRRNIKHLTEDMYRLPNIKYLHLEGNVISTLPKDLFQKLPRLVWLDLRYNKIKALPPGIGFHRHLKTLLLERNPIKELPAELGHLTSLTALNLRHCPIEYPPKEVIQKGLKTILSFLRDSGNGNLPCMEPATSETLPVMELHLSELWQRSLDLSQERPRQEEKRRLRELRAGTSRKQKEALPAEGCDGCDGCDGAGRGRQKPQLCPHPAGPGR
ncbi:leucine-rich repeat-containing protein 27 [Melopsittacus undulatus]|uniref:leucine-rich repeat-containing protein 27 n=1 Tax=Melopsittacus undulatus TaxID=13146 RepID=UPI00146EFF36|nr:leucine-rich repeat-containing protein 27 [Melopsittacus undulatus]